MKKAGIVVGILAGLAAIGGAYLLFNKPKQKAPEAPEADAPAEETGATKKTVVAPKEQPAGPNKTGPGFQASQKPVAAPKAPAKGKKLWVYANAAGVKAYKLPKSRALILGDLHKTYKKNEIIGVFTGTTSGHGQKYFQVLDGSETIRVPESQTYTKTV